MESWVQYTTMKEKILKILADFLGVEPGDINDEDSLIEDLHMTPSDLTDFVELLSTNGLDTTKLEISEIESLNDLYEFYS